MKNYVVVIEILVTKPQAVITRSRFATSQGGLDYDGESQNRKRSSQGRGQARKPALQAAEKGIFEKLCRKITFTL